MFWSEGASLLLEVNRRTRGRLLSKLDSSTVSRPWQSIHFSDDRHFEPLMNFIRMYSSTSQMPDFMDVVEPYLNRGDRDYLALILRHCSPVVDPEHHIGQVLHEAIFRNDEIAVRMILGAGADPKRQQPCDPGFTPLLAASQYGNLELARLFWQLVGPDGRFFPSKRPHLSCLAVAARNGHVNLVAYFLDVWDGWTDDEKCRALCDAASSWCDDVVALLLSENGYGSKALQDALQKMMFGKQILPEAAMRSQPKTDEYVHQKRVIHRLIDAGASPDVLTNRQMNEPLLHMASRSRDGIGALTALLEKGANANVQDSRGRTALHRLTRMKSLNADAISVLLQYGASPDIVDEDGETTFYNVVRFGSLDQLQSCLLYSHDLGAAIVSRNCFGESLLHHAAAGDREDFVDYLLSHGADINSSTVNGWTPLMCALTPTKTEEGPVSYRLANRLLQQGAIVQVVTDEGWTPLHALATRAFHISLLNGESGEGAGPFAQKLILCGAPTDTEARIIQSSSVTPTILSDIWGTRMHKLLEDTLKTAEHEEGRIDDTTPLMWAMRCNAMDIFEVIRAHFDALSMNEVILAVPITET